MRNLILKILLIIPLMGTAQESITEYLNFELTEDKDLMWQKVYETENTLNKVLKFLDDKSFTSNLELNGNTISGRSGKTKLSSKKGITSDADPSFDVFIKIDFKNGRYRVTINDLQFDPVQSSASYGQVSMSSTRQLTLNEIVLRKKHHEIKNSDRIKNLLTILDKDFNSHFIVKESKEDDNW